MSKSLKQMTVEEFRKKWRRSGESVMQLAFIAMHVISDDEEFKQAAIAAVEAEDRFDKMLQERNVDR